MISDFARHRAAAPSVEEPLSWVEARRMRTGQILWIPFDMVSLDFSRPGDTRLDRSSNGLGAGLTREFAMATAVLEVIERDALQIWRASSIDARSRDRVAAQSIPYAWFRGLSERIRAAGLHLAIYRLRAVIGLPVLVSELIEHREGLHYRRALGASPVAPCRRTPCRGASSRPRNLA